MSEFRYSSTVTPMALQVTKSTSAGREGEVVESRIRDDYRWPRSARPIGFRTDPRQRSLEEGQDLMRRIRACAEADPDECAFFIYDELDGKLSRGDFDACNAVLHDTPSGLPTVCSLAILSITYSAREKLTNRDGFARRLRDVLARTDPDRVEELLAGLE